MIPGRLSSFRARLLIAFLFAVGVVVGASLWVVRSQTERQVDRAARDAAHRVREAFTELEELQRLQLQRVGGAFTESRRTLALVEAAIESGDLDYLEGQTRYELERARLGPALAVLTDGRGRPVLSLMGGRSVTGDDPADLAPAARALLDSGTDEALTYRAVAGRLFTVRLSPLVLGARPVGVAAFGLPLNDRVAGQLSDIAGAEVCFLVRGECLAGTPASRRIQGRLAGLVRQRLASGEMGPGEAVAMTAAGARWGIGIDPLVPDRPSEGFRVVALPLDEVLAPFDRITRSLALAGGGALVVAFLLSLFLSRGLARPIRQLTAAAGRIGEGDYRARVRLERSDEIGRLGQAFDRMAEGLELKERYRGVLDKVVSRDVADELLRGEVALGGENREVTVLFADLSGFTTLSEGMEPQAVIALLNECMARLADAVEAEGGIVDKFVGDEVMAVFGAPVSQAEHLERAVRAAIAMQRSVEVLNRDREARGEAPLGLSVGVHTGVAVAGNMGSPSRLNYTVLGETVNLASRLCSAASADEILVSDEVRRGLEGDTFRDSLIPQGERQLKGFSRPLPLWKIRWRPR